MPLATPNLPPPAQFRAIERPAEPPPRAPATPKPKPAGREANPGNESFAGALRRSNDRDRAVAPERDAQKTPDVAAPAREDRADSSRAESDANAHVDPGAGRAEGRPEEIASVRDEPQGPERVESPRQAETGAGHVAVEDAPAAANADAGDVTNPSGPVAVAISAALRATLGPPSGPDAGEPDVTSNETTGAGPSPGASARDAGPAGGAREPAQPDTGNHATGGRQAIDAETSRAAAAAAVEEQHGEGERPAGRAQHARRGGARGLERLLERSGGATEAPGAALSAPTGPGDVREVAGIAAGAQADTAGAQAAPQAGSLGQQGPTDPSLERGASVNSPGAARAESRKRSGSAESEKASGVGAERAPSPGQGAPDASRAAALGLGGAERAQRIGATSAPTGGASAVSAGSGDEADALRATVSRGLSAAVSQKGGTITLRLEPETLGALRIQLDIVGGVVNARFEATSEQTAELLSRSIDSLRASLESKGLGVDRIRVDVTPQTSGGHAGAGGQSGSGQQQQGGAGREDLQRGFSHDAGEGRSRGFADDRGGARDGAREGWRDEARSEAAAAPVFERWLRLGLDATA